jgi:hypothetical protein
MKIQRQWELAGIIIAFTAASPGLRASPPTAPGGPAQVTHMVVTIRPAHKSGTVRHDLQTGDLQARDLTVMEGKTPVPVIGLRRFAGDLAGVQLVVLLDDSTRTSGLGIHLPELREFLTSLPSTTQVAVGFVRNGTPALPEAFTADHEKAGSALRLPLGAPGVNGSPYFGLSDVVKHWPSKEPTGRRAVLLLTDGVDRYFGAGMVEDPYVDAAIQDALKSGVTVYSIYLRSAGLYDRGDVVTNFGQSRLDEVSRQTGGHAYFDTFSDPVTITPFLNDLMERLGNQYEVTFSGLNEHGMQPVKLRTEVPGLQIEFPARVFVQ